jgi:hypothetical protein
MDVQGIESDPIAFFDSEIKKFIERCIEEGELIVLGIDANTDVRQGDFVALLESLGLIQVFKSKFGTAIPPTYARGSLPIDSFFISASLSTFGAGLLPVLCDHHILWLDLPHSDIFGTSLQKLPDKISKRLILQDPRIVLKYTAAVEAAMDKHKVASRLLEIQHAFSMGADQHAIAMYEEVDKIRTEAILHADKKCRKLRMGNIPFSPTLLEYWKKILAWKLLIRKLEGRKVDSKLLTRKLKSAGIREFRDVTLSEAKENLETALTNYCLERRNASEYRATWIEGLAAARANIGNVSAAQELRNMLMRERQRSDARQIKQVLSNQDRRGLHSIEVLNKDGLWQELSTQTDIEQALLEELAARFNQASSTPFCKEPLLSYVGPLGELSGARDILRGTASLKSLDSWADKLLPFLAQAAETQPIVDQSDAEYVASWKRVNERTSAGPS